MQGLRLISGPIETFENWGTIILTYSFHLILLLPLLTFSPSTCAPVSAIYDHCAFASRQLDMQGAQVGGQDIYDKIKEYLEVKCTQLFEVCFPGIIVLLTNYGERQLNYADLFLFSFKDSVVEREREREA